MSEQAIHAPPASERPLGVVVVGMHRAGTSALTRCMSALGARLPKNILGPGDANTSGHWEPERLVARNDALLAAASSAWDDIRPLNWSTLPARSHLEFVQDLKQLIREEYDFSQLFVLKDPRISRMVAPYQRAIEGIGFDAAYVVSVRNPLDVVASLTARDKMTPGYASLLWLRHVLDAEQSTRGSTRAISRYETLMADWQSAVSDIAQRLTISWPNSLEAAASEIDSFLNEGLRHFWSRESALEHEPFGDWLAPAYAALMELTSQESEQAHETLDRIKCEFDEYCSRFANVFVSEIFERQHRLCDEINVHKAAISNLGDEVKSNIERAIACEESSKNLTFRLSAAEESSAQANAAASSLETSVARLEKERDTLRAKIAEMTTREAEMQRGAEDLSSRLGAALHLLETQSAAQSELLQRVVEFEKTKVTAQASADEVRHLRILIDTLQQDARRQVELALGLELERKQLTMELEHAKGSMEELLQGHRRFEQRLFGVAQLAGVGVPPKFLAPKTELEAVSAGTGQALVSTTPQPAALHTQCARALATLNLFEDVVAAIADRAVDAQKSAGEADKLEREYEKMRAERDKLSDEFSRASTDIDELQREAAALRSSRDALELDNNHVVEKLNALRSERQLLLRDIGAVIDATPTSSPQLDAELAEARSEIRALRRSTSWRLTAPLRGVARMLGRR